MTIKEYTLKNGEKRYMFQVYVGVNPLTGKEQRTTRRGFKTKKQAELALARIKLQIESGSFGNKTLETFEDVYNEWIKEYEKTVEESTFMKVKGYFKNQIIPTFGKYRISKIDTKTCEKHVKKWKEKLVEFRSYKGYASMVFDYAVKEKIISSNPMDKVRVTTSKKVEDDLQEIENLTENFYTREELKQFLDYVKKDCSFQMYVLFRLLAFSGMRKGEALALTWDDINFKDNEIRINKALSRGKDNRLYVKATKNKKSIRTISMDHTTMEILKDWRTKQKQVYLQLGFNTLQPKQLVFSNKNNEFIQPPNTNNVINKIHKKYKIKKITTHGFRHTHCSLLFEAGASLEEVKERLGHADVKTTINIYTHVSKKTKDETAQKFARYMEF